MRQLRLIQVVALVLGLAIFVTGCGTKQPAAGGTSPTGGKGEQTAPATPGQQTGSNPAGGQSGSNQPPSTTPTAPALPKVAGDMAALEAAYAQPSPLTYKIAIADAPKGADKTAYLDEMLGDKGYPDKNQVLLLIFPEDNNDIRFAMGALLFEKKVSVESMLNMVRTHYLPKARQGDPAGGLADLIRAVNQQVK
ncbi:MAG: TPM domain-containing protein [Bacillota bacterium]